MILATGAAEAVEAIKSISIEANNIFIGVHPIMHFIVFIEKVNLKNSKDLWADAQHWKKQG